MQQSEIPGAVMSLTLDPFQGPSRERVTALHGAVTAARGLSHDTSVPDFAIFPSRAGSGWSLYMRDERDVSRMAGSVHAVRVGRARTSLVLGIPRRVTTIPHAPGLHRMRIHAITPVVTRCDGGKRTRTKPTGEALTSTLALTTAPRIGAWVRKPDAYVTVIADHTTPQQEHLPKLGYVKGWVGTVEVECTHVAADLLMAAQEISLGGRVAFGFGRIVVEPC